MKIGLIDVDAESRGKITYPNLSLMKISAWHKQNGDMVGWHKIGEKYDKVYVSKVFSDEYSEERLPFINTEELVRGGSGYAIKVEDGREVYHKEFDTPLDDEIEHIMPDYSLYMLTEDCYGFLTRGCPRGCNFCHVAGMQGRMSHTVSRLTEFWNGQKVVHLNDANILACKDWAMHFEDLARSKAQVDFNQGLDVRFLTQENAEALNQLRYKAIHFAWDRYEDHLENKLEQAKSWLKKCNRGNTTVYVLCNNGEPIEQDIERVEFIKSLRMQPYVMIYREPTASKELKRLKRYANNPYICWAVPTFNDYVPGTRSDRYGKTGEHRKRKIDKHLLESSND